MTQTQKENELIQKVKNYDLVSREDFLSCSEGVQELLVILNPRHLRWMENPKPELLMHLAKNSPHFHLSDVREQTEELCLEAVRRNPGLLDEVRDKTEEICMTAIRRKGRVVFCVKEPSDEMLLAAVIQNPDVLFHIHKDLSKRFFMDAVRGNPFALRVLNKKIRSSDLCRIAVEREPLLLKDVPEQTEEICQVAVDACFQKKKLDELPEVLRMVNDRFLIRVSRYVSEKFQETGIFS